MMASEVSIVDYLSSIGYNPRPNCVGKYIFYFSPFRNESKASFMVRKTDYRWSDPGHILTNVKGRKNRNWHSLIDLVCEMENCSVKEASAIITGKSITNTPKCVYEDKGPSIEVVSEKEITDNRLVNYLTQTRKVDIDIARIYTKEVGVRYPNSKKDAKKVYFGIGFKNDKGGWDIRNSFLKSSTSPNYYTTIDGDADNSNGFEGFMDFLSGLTYWRTEKFKNTTYVLNGLCNVMYLVDKLKGHTLNNIFWDNDDTAERYLDYIKNEGVKYVDHRGIFNGYNDFNKFLTG